MTTQPPNTTAPPAFDQGSSAVPLLAANGAPADMATHFEVQQLYYTEAKLLDTLQFGAWVDLFAEDLRYWMPVKTNRLRRQLKLSVLSPGETAYYDETKASLAWRVRRFDSGMAWAEDPPSRTRHLVTNVVVTMPDPDDETHASGDLVAESNYAVYRQRLEHETGWLVGNRIDLLRRTDDGLKVCRRSIFLEANVLHQKNISTFF